MGVLLESPQGINISRGIVSVKAIIDMIWLCFVALILIAAWPFTRDDLDDEND